MNRDPLETVSAAFAGVVREHFTLFVSEKQSYLGADGHIRAVLRRIACGEPGAVMLDGKYLLSFEAHEEETELLRRLKKAATEPPKGGLHA
jgi:hypothetical protein